MLTKLQFRLAIATLSLVAAALAAGLYFQMQRPAPHDNFDLSDKATNAVPGAIEDVGAIVVKPLIVNPITGPPTPLGLFRPAIAVAPEGVDVPEGSKFVQNIRLTETPPLPAPSDTVYVDEAILDAAGVTVEDVEEALPEKTVAVMPAQPGEPAPQPGAVRIVGDRTEVFDPDYGWVRNGDRNEKGEMFVLGFGWTPYSGPNTMIISEPTPAHAGDTTIIGY
jgi:hypothetical protein